MKSTLKKIAELWKQFLPLSLSDVAMAITDPLVNTTLAQMPKAQLNLAALGAARAFIVFFESPIIMILHASNTFAKDPKARQALWKFMLLCSGGLFSILLILLLGPIYQYIAPWLLGPHAQLNQFVQIALFILILWPAAIAWRRYFQGILIANGYAKAVGSCALFRVAVVIVTLSVGYTLHFSGIYLGASALMLGILAESVSVTLIAKKHGLGAYAQPIVPPSPTLNTKHKTPTTVSEMARFYWPLANSMLVMWGGRALLIVLLARSVDSAISLALWPATWGIVLVFGNATRMVQQVTIKNKDREKDSLFFLFSLSVGLVFSSVLVLFGSTNIGHQFLLAFIGNDAQMAQAMHTIVLISSPIPILLALQNTFQGFLMTESKTMKINLATMCSTVILLSGTFVAICFQWSGALCAAYSMLFAQTCEVILLLCFYKMTRKEKLILCQKY